MKKIVDKINLKISDLISFLKKYNVGFLIIYKVFIDLVYMCVITKHFAYSGFAFDFSLYKYLIGWIAYFVFIYNLKDLLKKETFSSQVIYYIFLLYFIPSLSVYGISNYSNWYFLAHFVYGNLFLLFNKYINYIKININLKSPVFKVLFRLLLIIVPIFVIGISFYFTKFRMFVSLDDIYKIRLESRAYSIPKILKYALSMLNVVLPLLLAYSLQKKKYWYSIIMIFCLLLLFGFTAQKTIFLFLIIFLFSHLFYKKEYCYLFGFLIIFGGIFAIVESRIFDSINIWNILYRRNLFLPSKICNDYLSFFKYLNYDYFTDSIMRWFGAKPIYGYSLPIVLGNYYAYSATNLNNGLISDAISNLGVLGLFIMPLILVIIFRLMDSVSYNISRKIVFAFSICYAMIFIDSSWSLTLLSGGFLAVIFLIALTHDLHDKDDTLEEYKEFKFITLKESIKNNKYKIGLSLLAVLGLVFVYYSIISINRKEIDKNYYQYSLKQSFTNECDKFNYYHILGVNAGKSSKEIDDFLNTFSKYDVDNQKVKQIVSLSKDINKRKYYCLIEIDNNNNNNYKIYEVIDKKKNKSKSIDDISNYYKKIDLYYKLINEISFDLISQEGINITYSNDKYIMDDYNIHLTYIYNNNNNNFLSLLIFSELSTIVIWCYLIASNTIVGYNKKTRKKK